MILTDAFQRVTGDLVARGTSRAPVYTCLVRRNTRPVFTAWLS